ncbi:MAG: nitroreductase [Saprospiraceae bacterium]
MQPEVLNHVIRRRRSIFPPLFSEVPVDREVILQMLENANWAPTHRRTEPWRFQVFRGEARHRLARFMTEAYAEQHAGPTFSEAKAAKISKNILRSDTVIIIILQRDREERVPEWEEIAALSAAVQNLWLTATAYGLGGYWSTPGTLPALTDRLALPEGQRCMGLFYLGHPQLVDVTSERGPVDDKVIWVES